MTQAVADCSADMRESRRLSNLMASSGYRGGRSCNGCFPGWNGRLLDLSIQTRCEQKVSRYRPERREAPVKLPEAALCRSRSMSILRKRGCGLPWGRTCEKTFRTICLLGHASSLPDRTAKVTLRAGDWLFFSAGLFSETVVRMVNPSALKSVR